MRPDRRAHPLPLFDRVRVGFLDQLAHPASVSPRQSPSSAILCEISSDAEPPSLPFDFFIASSWEFKRNGLLVIPVNPSAATGMEKT